MKASGLVRTIESISLVGRYAVGSDQAIGKITSMFDADGDETEEVDEVLAIVVAWPDGLFSHLGLVDCSRVRTH